MFLKYNAVMRGLLANDSTFLQNTMITLCCPRAVAEAYMGDTPWDKLFMPATGKLSIDEAKRHLNRYTRHSTPPLAPAKAACRAVPPRGRGALPLGA